jgi:hypothetical protein
VKDGLGPEELVFRRRCVGMGELEEISTSEEEIYGGPMSAWQFATRAKKEAGETWATQEGDASKGGLIFLC